MIDFIIVGSGLAGINFANIALDAGKKVFVFDNHSQPSSTVAGGMYNPVVLKRFTEIWKAQEQVQLCQKIYPKLEDKLNVKFDFPMQLFRKFASIEEQNNWFVACDKPSLSPFLNSKINYDSYDSISALFGFGEVFSSGYLDIKTLVNSYQEFLESINSFSSGTFDYNALIINEDFIQYKDIKTRRIIFAEGFGLHQNPFFNDLPLDGTKGELLHIKAPDLKLDKIIKSSIFVLPIGNDIYKVGATYNWKDKTNLPTEAGKTELVEKLKEVINCDFEIIEHLAGVRPTVNDRRPLVGTHYTYKRLHVLNGLGTRGVMLAPYLALNLFNYLENNMEIEDEINIDRYYKKRAKL
ncbi:MAG: FAD-dependent oxidoreductase [Flavobacterium haoranii]